MIQLVLNYQDTVIKIKTIHFYLPTKYFVIIHVLNHLWPNTNFKRLKKQNNYKNQLCMFLYCNDNKCQIYIKAYINNF